MFYDKFRIVVGYFIWILAFCQFICCAGNGVLKCPRAVYGLELGMSFENAKDTLSLEELSLPKSNSKKGVLGAGNLTAFKISKSNLPDGVKQIVGYLKDDKLFYIIVEFSDQYTWELFYHRMRAELGPGNLNRDKTGAFSVNWRDKQTGILIGSGKKARIFSIIDLPSLKQVQK